MTTILPQSDFTVDFSALETKIEIEFKSCRIDNVVFIWHKDGVFQVEDVDASVILPISKSQLIWFIEAVSDLNRKSEDSYFYKKEKLERWKFPSSEIKTVGC